MTLRRQGKSLRRVWGRALWMFCFVALQQITFAWGTPLSFASSHAEPGIVFETKTVFADAAKKIPNEARGKYAKNHSASTTTLHLDDVVFDGRVYFREDTLRGFIEHPLPGRYLPDVLQNDVERIRARYRERGYLQAQVSVSLVPSTEDDHVFGRVQIVAGARATLLSVDVVGNLQVKDEELTKGFFSRAPEPLGALTRAGFFHRPFLDQDAQRLIANYYEHGFLEAQVTGIRVVADQELQGLHVTLDVMEGARYELAGIDIVGDIPEGQQSAELRSHIQLNDGDIANLVALQKQAEVLTDLWRNQGFPFAKLEQGVRVADAPSGRADRRGLWVQLQLNKGPSATVRKIRIVGSPGTREHVFRREIVQQEGERYDHNKLKESERRLLALGYFQKVEISSVELPQKNEVDLEVRVVEQPTWILSPTAFVAAEGLVGVLVAGDRNLLGFGWFASFMGQLSVLRQLFDLSLTDPHFVGTDVSLTLEAHRRELGYPDFRLRSLGGGGLRFNVPLQKNIRWGVGAMAEYGGVVPFEGVGFESSELLPSNTWRNLLQTSLAWDQRDSVLSPRNGVFAQLRLSYGGPFTLSGISALDVDVNLRLYWTPFFGITLKSNTELATVSNPHGGEVAVTDRYYLGNIGSIRGYFPRSISPTRRVRLDDGTYRDVRVGGVSRFVENLEVELPFWAESPLRGFAFVDVGNAWDTNEKIFSDELIRDGGLHLPWGLYWATGFGVLIDTPVFPLRLQVSLPLTRRPIDREWDFFVGVGSSF